jgi:hypothetical protein
MLRRTLRAIIDLQCETESELRERRAMHAFGATLGEAVGRESPQHDRVEAPLARDMGGF